MKHRGFWRYARMLLYYRRLMVAAFAAALLDAACKAGGFGTMAWVIRQFIEEGVTLQEIALARTEQLKAARGWDLTQLVDMLPAGQWSGLALTLGAILLLAIVGSVGRYFHEYWTFTVSLRTVMRIRRMVFTRLVHLPMAVAGNEKTAEQISRVNRDTQFLSNGFNALTGRAVSGVLSGAALLLLALWMDWRLTGLFMLVLPPVGILIRKFGKLIRRAMKGALAGYGSMLGVVTEALHGLRVVKVHHAEGYERRRFNQVNRAIYDRELRARVAKSLSSPVIETISMAALMGVVLIAAWSVFQSEERDTTQLMAVLITLVGAAQSFRALRGLNEAIQTAAAAAENIDLVLALPVEARPRGDALRKIPALPQHCRSVRFENVSFSYPQRPEPVLRGVSFEVPHGSSCAVVGANGSGKSTLLGLLPRLYEPTGGRVLIDGHNIAEHRLRSLRRQIAMVTQETVLFDGTVAENITYGARHVSEQQVLDAARRAHADGFISALPEGYHTQVGERGQRLSGGQRQRIAIARAILRDPAILILDEATSQIDADSEARINDALAEFSAGRTTFIIAHRLSTVIDADSIVVLDAGKLVGQGRHGELLESCEAYRTICRSQLRA